VEGQVGQRSGSLCGVGWAYKCRRDSRLRKEERLSFHCSICSRRGHSRVLSTGFHRGRLHGVSVEGACVGSRRTCSLSGHEDGEFLSCFERMAMGEDCERSEEKKYLGNHGRGLLLLHVREVLSRCKLPNTDEDTAHLYLSSRPISIQSPTSRHGKHTSKISLGGVCSILSCLGPRRVRGYPRGRSLLGEASLTLARLRFPRILFPSI
jgi:hypothetical protein